jgi:hypothetical protein
MPQKQQAFRNELFKKKFNKTHCKKNRVISFKQEVRLYQKFRYTELKISTTQKHPGLNARMLIVYSLFEIFR